MRGAPFGAPPQLACKPDSVWCSHPSHRVLGTGGAFALQPTWISPGRVVDPAWPCTGRGLPGRRVTATPVRSYRTISPLPVRALAIGAPSAVSFLWHCPAGFPGWALPTVLALWCPDFPREFHLPRLHSQPHGLYEAPGLRQESLRGMIDSMPERVVKGACPHDCPDTCAMLTTVDEDGPRDRRSAAIPSTRSPPASSAARSPTTSTASTRPTASSQPLIRTGAKGDGEFRRASWDEALDARGRRAARGDRRARRRVGAPLQLHGHPGGAPGRLDRAPADERDRRDASSCARSAPPPGSPASVATQGVSPEVDPEEWPHARYLLVWGWNPMSTAPHLWRKLLDARRNGARLCVVDPFRSRTARVADEHLRPLPGHRRGAGAGDDARGRRRRARRRGVVSRARRRLRRAARAPRRAPGRALGGDLRGRRRRRSRAVALDFARTQPALLRLGVGAQRHLGAPIAYRTIACLPALVGAWRHRGGGCSYIPTATASGGPERGARRAPSCARARSRRINMSQLGEALTDPDARAAGEGARRLVLEPRPDRARPGAGARGAAARGPVHARGRAVHDRHRRATPT